MLHIFNIICWRESRIFLTERTFRVFRKTVVTDSFPLTADCEFLIYIHNHISLAVLWERVLFVSLNTIKTHTSKLFEKMDVKRRTQAVELAKRLNLIP